jgi:DNA repair protein RadC
MMERVDGAGGRLYSRRERDGGEGTGGCRMTSASYRIRDMATSERPRERLRRQGAEALSAAELVAVLIGTGTRDADALQLAQVLLMDVGGVCGLRAMPIEALCLRRGMGEAKAARLKAGLELGIRSAGISAETRQVVQGPEDVADLLRYEMASLEQEEFRVVLLDTRNRVVRTIQLYHGSLNTSLVRVGEVFRDAVRMNAAAIILVHNHPSGDPSPSPEDVAVTGAIVEAGRLLDIDVLDHVVLGRAGHVSMKARGLGFHA